MSSPYDSRRTIEDDAAIARLLAQDMGHHAAPSTFEDDIGLAQMMSREQQTAQSTFESDAEMARRLAGEEDRRNGFSGNNNDNNGRRRSGSGAGGMVGRALGGMLSAAPGNRRANPTTTTTTTTTTSSSGVLNCPGHHGLEIFEVSPSQRARCDACKRSIRSGEQLLSCVQCDYDACSECYQRGGPPPRSISSHQPSSFASANPRSFAHPEPSSIPDNHMCVVPCVIGGGACVEMMVDTGAQSSVISLQLARELQLDNRIDRSYRGMAAGVGRAAIIGKIRHVICTMGNVEFDMDFIVLDVQEKLLLLGLDLMRKFKCIVDLDGQRLIFGGMDGVDVPFLPPEEQHIPAMMMNGHNCPMM